MPRLLERSTREKKILTMDEQLAAFLQKWEATRAGQVEKFRLRAEANRSNPTMQLCYECDLRAMRHHAHELAMLRELHARALP